MYSSTITVDDISHIGLGTKLILTNFYQTRWQGFVHWLDGRKYIPYEEVKVISIMSPTTLSVMKNIL